MTTDRLAVLVFTFALANITADSAAAAPTSISPMDTRLTVRLANAPLREALKSFSAQTGAVFLIADGVNEGKLVALRVEKFKAGKALEELLRPVGLYFRRIASSQIYIIMPNNRQSLERSRREILDRDKALDVRLRIRVGHVPFRNLLDMITAETKIEFALEPGKDRRRVSLDLKDASARDTLEAALDLKGLEIAASGAGTYLIRVPGK